MNCFIYTVKIYRVFAVQIMHVVLYCIYKNNSCDSAFLRGWNSLEIHVVTLPDIPH